VVAEPGEERGGRYTRPALEGSAVATGRGDDGSTGLLYGGERIAKNDERVEAYGTIDEAVAILGVARADLRLKADYGVQPPQIARLGELLLGIQRELFVAAAEIATNPDAWNRLEDGRTRVSEAMVTGLESTLAELEAAIEMPREFVVPGETRLSATLEVARTVMRRAERRVLTLRDRNLIPGEWLLPYLNRLADLLWVLARAAEQAESRQATPARTSRRSARSSA
jgi:cob(I)alamin adenosyltransferase